MLWERAGFPTLATKIRCRTSLRSSKKCCDGTLSHQSVRITLHHSPSQQAYFLPAVPHRLIVDDVYEGYFLPAGSIVIGNSW